MLFFDSALATFAIFPPSYNQIDSSITIKDAHNQRQRPPYPHSTANTASTPKRELVLGVAQRLHYRPNRVARGLVTGRSHTLGLVLSDIRNPFFAEVARGAEDAACAAAYDLVLCNSDLDAEKQLRYVQSLAEKRVDGILMNSVAELTRKQVEQLSSFGVPIVLLNRTAPRNAFSTICADNIAGGALAAQYLSKLGHRKIAHITGPPPHGNMTDRAPALSAPSPNSAGRSNLSFSTARTISRADRTRAELLAQHANVTAIFAASDMMAFGAIRAHGSRMRHSR